MTGREIASKTQKIIKMNKGDYIINTVYFNPAFLSSLYDQVPELAEAGIKSTVTETETDIGTLISGMLSSPKRQFSLGSVLLDGEEIKVKKKLTTIDKIIDFIVQEVE